MFPFGDESAVVGVVAVAVVGVEAGYTVFFSPPYARAAAVFGFGVAAHDAHSDLWIGRVVVN